MQTETSTTKKTKAEVAIDIAADVNARLAKGQTVYLVNHLRALMLTKRNVGALAASGNGLRVYGGAFWPVGSFSVRVQQ